MYKKWPISPSLKSARSKNNMKVFQKLVKFFNISYAFCVQTIRYLSFIKKNSPGLEEGVKSSMSFMKCLITRLIPNTNVKSLNNVCRAVPIIRGTRFTVSSRIFDVFYVFAPEV